MLFFPCLYISLHSFIDIADTFKQSWLRVSPPPLPARSPQVPTLAKRSIFCTVSKTDNLLLCAVWTPDNVWFSGFMWGNGLCFAFRLSFCVPRSALLRVKCVNCCFTQCGFDANTGSHQLHTFFNCKQSVQRVTLERLNLGTKHHLNVKLLRNPRHKYLLTYSTNLQNKICCILILCLILCWHGA